MTPPIPLPQIAVRFHPYWAGSDPDGEIAGFYFAVVETLPIAPPGTGPLPPPLPGPKPQDYRFTTKTDSVFIFRVSEEVTDRQHAFFIYAVDNQGKADPTPARIIFISQDRFPPIPFIDVAMGSGRIYRMDLNGAVSTKDTVVHFTEMQPQGGTPFAPRDVAPLNARLDFAWHAEPAIAGTYVTGYRYKLDESQFNSVDSSVTSVSYNTGVGGDIVQPGPKVFILRAVDEAGGSKDTNRRFGLNYAPETWFSGPDSTTVEKRTASGAIAQVDEWGERYIEVTDLPMLGARLANTMMSCDSLTLWPGMRPKMKTFIEIWDPDGLDQPARTRLYVRSENDTVHINSVVVLMNGGSDLDSPYAVRVNPIDPDYLLAQQRCGGDLRALTPAGPMGSPTLFRSQLTTVPWPNGRTLVDPFSNFYPVFDPVSSQSFPRMSSYNSMISSGKVYALVRAMDGNGEEDRSVTNAKALADTVDFPTNPISPLHRRLRDERVLTFYVNKAPALLFSVAQFFPRPGQTIPRSGNLNLRADDVDPFGDPRPANAGEPSDTKVLRWRVAIKGLGANGDTVIYRPTLSADGQSDTMFTSQIRYDIPSTIVSTTARIEIQICDCVACEITPGQGVCQKYSYLINLQPLAVGKAAPELEGGRPGPGSSVGGVAPPEGARRFAP